MCDVDGNEVYQQTQYIGQQKHWNENQRCLLQHNGNTDKHWWITSECFFLVHTYFKSSVAYDKHCCAKCQRTLVVCNSQVDRSFYGEIKRRCWLRKSSEMATGTPEFIPLDNLLSSGMLATQETQSVGRTSLKLPLCLICEITLDISLALC